MLIRRFIWLFMLATGCFAAETDSGTEDYIEISVRATLDGHRTLMIYSKPPSENYTTDYHEETTSQERIYTQVYTPTWSTIERGMLNNNREQSSIIIHESNYPEFPPYIFYNFYALKRFEMCGKKISEITEQYFERAVF